MPKAEVEIELQKELPGGWIYEVICIDGEEESEHEVELTKSDYLELTQGLISPVELIEKSFDFLLNREAKENILPEFNLLEISTHFPEYEEEIKSEIA